MIADQLAHIFIVGDDDDIEALRFGFLCQRADDVVSFIARLARDGHAQRFRDAQDVRKLHRQIVGHRAARRFVRLITFVAKGRFGRIKGDAEIIRLLLSDQSPQHHRETVDGIGRQALRIREAANGVVGAIDLRHSIDQNEPLAFGVSHMLHTTERVFRVSSKATKQ